MRLIVVVEGQTEEAFVRDVLVPHLAPFGVFATVTIVGKAIAERRGHRGRGGGTFKSWRRDLTRLLTAARTADLRVTTLFDLYGLPSDFPGMDQHGADPDTRSRRDALCAALAEDLADDRLIPYIQRHEFEALVLAALPSLRTFLDAREDLAGLDALARALGDFPPEDVNDGPSSAPSKRLLRHVPTYRKALHGPLATEHTGLAALRQVCPGFDMWVSQLKALGKFPTPL